MNMSDMFDLPVIDVVHHGYSTEQDRAAAHAINNHDKLVEMNRELIEALSELMTYGGFDLFDSDDIKQLQDLLIKAKELTND